MAAFDDTSIKTYKSNYNFKQNYIEQPWTIIETYFKGQHLQRLVRHQLESYNDFVQNQIEKTIYMFNPTTIRSVNDYDPEHKKYGLEMVVTFENFQLHRPQIYENNGATKIMFPQEARLRNFTYSSAMTLDINFKITRRMGADMSDVQIEHKSLKNIHIGKLPIMLKSIVCVLKQYPHVDDDISGECKYDPGGYFIINGSEKTVLAQERAAENKVYCFKSKKGNTKWSHTAEIKSVPDYKIISPKQINAMISNKNTGFGHCIYVQLPRMKQPIPLFVLFRALGVESDEEICNYITLNTSHEANKKLMFNMKGSIVEASGILTQEEAFQFIVGQSMYTPFNTTPEEGKKKKEKFTQDVLDYDMFPHCRTKEQKLYFLGYMIYRLIMCKIGYNEPDDRDSYLNKRIDLVGSLLNNLFRNYFNKLVKDMQKQIIREINNGSWRSTNNYMNIVNDTNIYKLIKPTTIENGLKRALSTGDFGIKNTNSNKVGVAQVLNRLTYISSLSHLRRINTPIDKSGKLVLPRKLHNSSWGFICPAETPEGQSVGVVKNIGYMTHVTIPSDSTILYEIANEHIIDINTVVPMECFGMVKVFVNGCWIGITDSPLVLYERFKECKYKGIINVYTSVTFNIREREIRVCNDSGRLTRPLLRVEDNELILTPDVIREIRSGYIGWDDLLVNFKTPRSVIEYIDADEQNGSMIAMTPKDVNTYSDGKKFYYTHCEIHPSTIFGILASCIPFPEHNQAPRNTYQCIDSTEFIRMDDGSFKMLKDIKCLDTVSTFNHKTGHIEPGKVIKLKTQKTTKDMYNVELVNGETVKATYDHKFFTQSGWKTVEELTGDDFVGMDVRHTVDSVETDDVCYDLTDCTELTDVDKKRLDGSGLLTTNYGYKTSILAKMFGFVMTDGSINVYSKGPMMQMNFTTMEAAEEFQREVVGLGFTQCKISESVRTFNGRTHHTWRLTYCGLIAKLFIALGITTGRRTEVPHKPVPEWITSNEYNIKAFLSGYFGGDGCRVRFNKLKSGHNYIVAPIQITKEPHLLDNGVEFMVSINNMLETIGIETKGVKVVENDDKYVISLGLSCNQDNIIRLFDTVGYSYDYHKQMTSYKIVTYLKWKKTLQTQYFEETGLKYFHLGEFTPESVCEAMSHIGAICFTPIKNVEPTEHVCVTDITVNNDNHNFILKKGFCVHNCAMGKQAMGMYVTNFTRRMDKTAYVLTYPMRPLVDTRVMNIINVNKIPSGENVIVAIATYSGYNQEDSIIFNKGSLDRGLFSATVYKTEKDEDKKIYGDEEVRCRPDKSRTKNIKFANYDKLDSKGLIPENTKVENKDVIIGKVIPIKKNRNDQTKLIKYQDQSKVFRTHEDTYVDKNYVQRNGDGYTFCKVRMRTYRVPVIGDKFSSRHGQKGTIGIILPEEDMPFTEAGVRPDIIINPHAIPSRMTIGQLKETVLGKVLVELGMFGDGTSFNDYPVKDICEELLKCGYEKHGNEILMNGMTGEQLETTVFIGPTFYQRLKHMVNDKQHSRNQGPMVVLTRQPAEGRSRDGGLRFGEMERDCVVSHGASRFAKGRLYDASDKFMVHVCRDCGMIAAYNDEKEIHRCNNCENTTNFAKVEIPYACKLLFQELISMNVAPRILTAD